MATARTIALVETGERTKEAWLIRQSRSVTRPTVVFRVSWEGTGSSEMTCRIHDYSGPIDRSSPTSSHPNSTPPTERRYQHLVMCLQRKRKGRPMSMSCWALPSVEQNGLSYSHRNRSLLYHTSAHQRAQNTNVKLYEIGGIYHTDVRAATPKIDSAGARSVILPRVAILVDMSATRAQGLLNALRKHSQVSQGASRLTGQVVASKPEHPQRFIIIELVRDRP